MKTIINNAILILCSGLLCFESEAQDFSFYKKLVAGDREEGDDFGYAVAVSDGYAIVGAPFEDEDVDGVEGSLFNTGSAYLLEKDESGDWSVVQKITASDRSNSDLFGWSVSISGGYAIVGAFQEDDDLDGNNPLSTSGSAYIFERGSGGTWSQVQKIVASDRAQSDEFGYSVSISGDYAIVGANGQNLDADGNNNLSNAGAAYIFERSNTGSWTQVQKLVHDDREHSDFFGVSVSISGDRCIAGAYNEDHDADGMNLASNAGSAYIFERDNAGVWNQAEKVAASDRESADFFGWSVAISGNQAVVGAYQENHDVNGLNNLTNDGAAYLFERDDETGDWSETQKFVASDRETGDEFGWSVAISDGVIAIGVPTEDEDANGSNELNSSGSIYVFEYNGSTWEQSQKLVAHDRDAEDRFGHSVSLSGKAIFSGAYKETDDESGNGLLNSGSVYLLSQREAQSINFTSFPTTTFSDSPFDLSTVFSTTSGLALNFTSEDETVATVSGNMLTILSVGTINITASQSGGSDFEAAEDVTKQLTIDKSDQAINFTSFPSFKFGDATFDLNTAFSTTSGLALSFASDDEAVATVSGGLLTIISAGTVNITASQTGGNNFVAATDVVQQLTIDKADQTISFDAISDLNILTAPLDLVATSTSNLPVSFESSDPGIATISGSQLSVVSPGTVTITASQAGNSNYNAATAAQQVEVMFVLSAPTYFLKEVSIYPNPVKNLLTIKAPKIRIDKSSITDLNGRLVKFQSEGSGVLDISKLKTGIYILEIHTTKELIRRRFVKE